MKKVDETRLRIIMAASGWVALTATVLPGGWPLRWIPALLFLFFGPGLAVLLPRPEGLREGARLEVWALAAPLSLSLGVLTATVLFLLEVFSATAFLVPLALITTVAAFLPGFPLPAALPGAAERVKRKHADVG
ncbi:hypothetical protein ACIBCM_29785 [Streptomyces sp. NPDC051018]|uniref:hypothetical protein n=1 Tax=Streptomyces sp. NPDC051018 TaxID=3365639 RepID=UPI00379103AD